MTVLLYNVLQKVYHIKNSLNLKLDDLEILFMLKYRRFYYKGRLIMKKLNIGLIYGGKSTEYEVSLRSAKSVLDALDKEKYNVRLIHVLKTGEWVTTTDLSEIDLTLVENKETMKVVPGQQFETETTNIKLDSIFSVLHGTYGEDGNVQGLLECANVAYVGCDTRGSAVAMDKDVTKRLLDYHHIQVADGVVVHRYEKSEVDYNLIEEALGLPMFIKPANQGSSVGVSKVNNEKEFNSALNSAFDFDDKVLIEAAIVGREIEVSVLGNDELTVSVPGEIVSNVDFYDYESKYLTDDGATLIIPAKLTEDETTKIRAVAENTYRTLDCLGYARVDVFLTESGEVIVNEINTLPGFTSISMYPKLMEESGIPYSELLDKLIDLSIEKYNEKNNIKFDSGF